MSSRFVDPKRHIERATEEAHGLLTARELSHQIDQGERLDAESSRTQRFFVDETIEVHCFNPAAGGGTSAFHMIATSAGTMTASNINPDVSQQCRLTYLRMMSTAPVTAGTITPSFAIFDSLGGLTSYLFDACQMNAVDNTAKSSMFDWEIAVQLEKDSTWSIGLIADAAYLPVTNDYKILLTFTYDQWV